MNIIKFFRKPFFAIFLSSLVLITSCSQESDLLVEENLNVIKPEVALSKFESSLAEIDPLLHKFQTHLELNKGSEIDLKSNPLANEILNKLSEPSLELFKDYGFNNDDFEEMFGTQDKKLVKDEIAGAGLLFFKLQTLSKKDSKSDTNLKSGSPLAVDCFLEATGIAAGVALIGALTGEVGGRALKKAFTKAVKKIGSRTLGGIGLVLMAAEFTWCMTR